MLEMGTVQVISIVGLSFAGGLFGLALKRMQKDMKEQRDMLDERHEGYVKLFAVLAESSNVARGRLTDIESRLRIKTHKGRSHLAI
jgi:hypothetical protein